MVIERSFAAEIVFEMLCGTLKNMHKGLPAHWQWQLLAKPGRRLRGYHSTVGCTPAVRIVTDCYSHSSGDCNAGQLAPRVALVQNAAGCTHIAGGQGRQRHS